MSETVKYGRIQRPTERDAGGGVERVVVYGTRTPTSAFDRRPSMGSTPSYVGPGNIQRRTKGVNPGTPQQKKHVSSGKGQG